MSYDDYGMLAGHCDACKAPVDYCLCGCDCDDVSQLTPCPSCHTKGD